MYTIVFEEDEVIELDNFFDREIAMEAYFSYMERQEMNYQECVALLNGLNKLHDQAEKIREEMKRRCGE